MKIKLLEKSRRCISILKGQSVLLLSILLGFGATGQMLAQYPLVPVGQNVNSSTLNCATLAALSGSNKTFTVGDDLGTVTSIYMDAELDLKCLGVITLIVKEKSFLDFSPGNNRLLLAEGSTLIFKPNSGLIGGSCNASERIYIGTNLLASCNGNAGADFSFSQLLAFGGSGSLSSNSPVCSGRDITLTATPPPTATGSFDYSFSGPGLPIGGTPFQVSPTINIATTTAGTFLYNVRMRNSGIAIPMIAEITVTVNSSPAKPTITASGPLSFCEGGSVTLTSSAGISYKWSTSATTASIQSSISGPISVQVGHAANSCLSLPSDEVMVNSIGFETPSVAISTSSPTTICDGTLVEYKAAATGAGSNPVFQWSVNGGSIGTNSSTYSSNGLKSNDAVSCKVYSSAVCTTKADAASNVIVMVVNPNLSPALSITPSRSGTICDDYEVTFSTAPVNGGGSPAYKWIVNGNDIMVNTPTFKTKDLKDKDVVSCILTSSEGCLTTPTATAAPIVMSVLSAPVAPILPSAKTLECAPITGFMAEWTSSAGASVYYLDVATDPNFANVLPLYKKIEIENATKKDVRGLLSSNNYYARVQAANFCGTSGYSNVTAVVLSGTIFDGTSWSNGPPNENLRAIFNGSATITKKLKACSCVVNAGAQVTVGQPGQSNSEAILMLEDELVVKGTMIFENNASLIQINDDPQIVNSGQIVYKRITRPMKDFDYTYWCSPVKNQNLFAISPKTIPDKYLSYGSAGWVIEGPQSTMDPAGKGFIVRVPRADLWPAGTVGTYSQEVQFKGVPNNGVIKRQTMGVSKDNLIGNPYPSALDADEFIKANAGMISNPLEIWTHNTAMDANSKYSANDYAYYNLSGGIRAISGGPRPNGRVAAGQGFFMVSDKAGDFLFTNAMRATNKILDTISNSQFFRMATTKKEKPASVQKERLWLNLTNKAGGFKEILVGYIEGATNDYDNLYDALCPQNESPIAFYSINSGKRMIIQARAIPFEESDQIPLGYISTVKGDFSIAIDSTDAQMSSRNIYLQDKLNGSFTNLSKGAFNFSSSEGVFNDRFVLWFKPNDNEKITSTSTSMEGLLVSVKNKQIKISSSSEIIDKVRLYDLKSSLLYEKTNLNSKEFTLTQFNTREQFLILQLLLKNGKVVTKEVIF